MTKLGRRYATRTAHLATVPPDVLRTVHEVEREHATRVLEICGGNRARTAHILGIDRKTLMRKLRRWGIQD
ncbi:MAG: two component, sigma54 specific, transcriptional regulator, Fis family [Myxococcales bacterium]|nr:two component, sigma54 specific, transcriptional regulator, Fis family [Myxococcales bacterium]